MIIEDIKTFLKIINCSLSYINIKNDFVCTTIRCFDKNGKIKLFYFDYNPFSKEFDTDISSFDFDFGIDNISRLKKIIKNNKEEVREISKFKKINYEKNDFYKEIIQIAKENNLSKSQLKIELKNLTELIK